MKRIKVENALISCIEGTTVENVYFVMLELAFLCTGE